MLKCSPEKGHLYVYWYRRLPREELKFMICLRQEEIMDQSGMPTTRYSAKFPREEPNVFKIEPAEPGDSAVYFCASSLSTPVQSHFLPAHKRPPRPPCTQLRTRCLLREQIGSEAFGGVTMEIGQDPRSSMGHSSPCSPTRPCHQSQVKY